MYTMAFLTCIIYRHNICIIIMWMLLDVYLLGVWTLVINVSFCLILSAILISVPATKSLLMLALTFLPSSPRSSRTAQTMLVSFIHSQDMQEIKNYMVSLTYLHSFTLIYMCKSTLRHRFMMMFASSECVWCLKVQSHLTKILKVQSLSHRKAFCWSMWKIPLWNLLETFLGPYLSSTALMKNKFIEVYY